MAINQFDDPAVLTQEGVFVSDKWLRLSEIIQDVDPYLELRWIPPANRSEKDKGKPYAIVHARPDQAPYIVMFAGELDNPVAILAKLWTGNTAKHDVAANLDAMEKAQKAFELHIEMEKREQAMDEARWFMSTNKNWITLRKPDGTLEKIDRTLPNGGRC